MGRGGSRKPSSGYHVRQRFRDRFLRGVGIGELALWRGVLKTVVFEKFLAAVTAAIAVVDKRPSAVQKKPIVQTCKSRPI